MATLNVGEVEEVKDALNKITASLEGFRAEALKSQQLTLEASENAKGTNSLLNMFADYTTKTLDAINAVTELYEEAKVTIMKRTQALNEAASAGDFRL